MKVELRPRAVTDLEEIRDFLLENASEQAANRVRQHLQQRIRSLGKRPVRPTATSHPSIRILSPTKYPYRIYYTVIDRTVVVLHVRHTSRQLPDLDEL